MPEPRKRIYPAILIIAVLWVVVFFSGCVYSPSPVQREVGQTQVPSEIPLTVTPALPAPVSPVPATPDPGTPPATPGILSGQVQEAETLANPVMVSSPETPVPADSVPIKDLESKGSIDKTYYYIIVEHRVTSLSMSIPE